MSFYVTVAKENGVCDACGVLNGEGDSELRPTIYIFQSSGRGSKSDRNIIFGHLDCIERKMAKAKKVAAL